MNTQKLALLIILAGLLFLQCSRKSGSDYVVKVGDQRLDSETFLVQYERTRDFARSKEFTVGQVRAVLEQTIVPMLLFQAEGYRLHLDQDSAFVAYLKDEKKRLLITGDGPLYHSIVKGNFEATDQEVQDFYDHLGVELKVAHLLVKSQHLADSLYQLLQDGADFDALTFQYSVDRSTATRGGVIPRFISWGNMAPAFQEAAFRLQEGEISAPVKTPYGYHIIKLIQKQSRERKPLADLQEQIRRKIEQNKKNLFIEKYLMNLYDQYQVNLDEQLVHQLLRAVGPNGKLLEERFSEQELEKPLVTFEGGSWSVGEFIRRYDGIPPQSRIPLRTPEGVEDYVKMTIVPDLLYQEALRRGLDKNDEFLKEFTRMKNSLVGRYCQNKLVTTAVAVSEQEALDFYNQNKTRFGNRPAKEVMPLLQRMLRSNKMKQKRTEVLEALRTRHPVEYNEQALVQVVARLNEDKVALAN